MKKPNIFTGRAGIIQHEIGPSEERIVSNFSNVLLRMIPLPRNKNKAESMEMLPVYLSMISLYPTGKKKCLLDYIEKDHKRFAQPFQWL